MATTPHDADERHRAKAARNRAAGATDFICECADLRCNAVLELSAAELERVAARPAGFWVKPGHAIAGLDEVVYDRERYAVVRKAGPAGVMPAG